MTKTITLNQEKIDFLRKISIKAIKLLCWTKPILLFISSLIATLVLALVPHFMEMTQNTLKTWFPDFKDWFTPTIIIAVECAIFVLFIFMNIAFSLIYTKVLKLNYTDNWKMWCKVALIISIMFGAVIIFIAFLLYYFLSNDSKEKVVTSRPTQLKA